MPPPEPGDGWLAQLLYLGSLGVAGMVAWLSRYRSGRDSERADDEEERVQRLARRKPDAAARSDSSYVVLEAAEIADMRAVRQLLPQLELVAGRLTEVFQIVKDNQRVVSDNQRIVETNRQILVILERIAHKMDVDEEVEARLQRQQVEELVRGKKDRE